MHQQARAAPSGGAGDPASTEENSMRTWKTHAAIGAATTALLAGVGGAAVSSVPAAGAPAVHVRHFNAVQIGHDHQVGKFGFVSSDVERRNGRAIGTDSVSGRFYPKKDLVKLYVAVAWKGGAVIVRGHATQNTPFVGKIVRGTGKYAGATGTVTTRDLQSGRTAVTASYTL
jgi:hypothetical protein